MTLKERIIVEVYTGYVMTRPEERGEVYKYMDEKMGKPVFAHELGSKSVVEQLREKTLDDFKALCISNEEQKQISYLLGENSTLVFDTGYVPEAIPYSDDTPYIDINDNHITMCVELHKDSFPKSKHKIFMTVEQAEYVIEALKTQIERL